MCGVDLSFTPVLDLDYAEDSEAETDANFIMTGSGNIVEIQATAEKTPFSEDQFAALLALARKGIPARIVDDTESPAVLGEPQVGEQGELGITVRYLTPHNKWSIHSEYQDNLFMLSLSRGGQNIWMSDRDAAKVGIKDNDWIEAVNRNGVVVARAIVSHRMPEGTVYMHHAQDRLIDVPIAETSGKRGGIHNSLTRLLVKPSHLIGGYAQLTFAFNYLGPTGNQRDEVTVIRRNSAPAPPPGCPSRSSGWRCPSSAGR